MWLGVAVAVARWLEAPARVATDGASAANPAADPTADPPADPTADPTADPAADPTDGATDGASDGAPIDARIGRPPRVWWRYTLVGAACVMLLPNIWSPDMHDPARSPEFFTDGLYHRYLQPGETIVFIHPGKGDEMLAQADAHFSFRLAQGHTGIAPPQFRGTPGFEQIDTGNPAGLTPTVLSEFLALHHVTAVVVQDSVAGQWRELLTGTLRVQPVSVGGVDVYHAPPGQLGF
jgi:hypothetical protein